MITLNNLRGSKGSRRKASRVGRWNGSWKWTYCGRGMNGQNSRSGWGVPDWFEWGQTPLFRRMPKLKGFSNARFKKHYNVINLSDLEKLATSGDIEITKELLLEKRIIRRKRLDVKLLWDGELTSKINIKVNHCSVSAKQAVEKAWGSVEVL